MTTLDQLRARKAILEARIAKTKARDSAAQRRADLHLKAALGGAVLIGLDNPNMPATVKIYLLRQAENGLQKKGIARQRFEYLKTKFMPIDKTTNQ